MRFLSKSFEFPVLDLRAIGVFRILMGSALILDILFNKWPFLEAFYSETGLFDQATLDSLSLTFPPIPINNWGFLHFLSSTSSLNVFFGLSLFCFFCLTIGYRSRIFSILSFIALWSIHQRNGLILSGPDEILINLLFISIFLPLDKRMSCFEVISPDPGDKQEKTMASFFVLFFIGMVYFFGAFLKDGHLWQSGEALSYALMEDIWTKPSSVFLLQFEGLCNFLTHATIWIEYAIPVLIFFPIFNRWTRLLALLLIIGLHGTMAMFLDLGLFPLIVLSYAVLLTPPFVWDGLSERLPIKFRSLKARKLNTWLNISGKKATALKSAFLLVVLGLMFWRCALHAPQIRRYLPIPKYIEVLGQTSLFNQFWGFYAPNPSITHGWYKLSGTDGAGEKIDLRTYERLDFDDNGLDSYKRYSWKVLLYKTIIIAQAPAEVFTNWARYEFNQSRKLSNSPQFQSVQLHGFTRTIISPGVSSAIEHVILGEWPPGKEPLSNKKELIKSRLTR